MNKRQQLGFTLLELLLLLIIGGIIASAVIALDTPEDYLRVSYQAKQLAADINYIKSYALASDQTVTITFTTNSYSASGQNNKPVLIPSAPGKDNGVVNLPDGLSLTPGNLIFNSSGTPTTAGVTITVTDGKESNTVTVSDTGLVTEQ